MKTKQLIFTIILAAALLFAWGLALKAATSTEIVDTQNALTAKADAFAEKELHIRAIPLYQEALSYETEQNSTIEQKLLHVYLASGRISAYLELAEQRLTLQTLTEEEALQTAKLYLADGKVNEALSFMEKALQFMESASVAELYEGNRYGYTMRTAGCERLLPTADNQVMPGFDGEAWYYINRDGRKITNIPYEFASRYNAGHKACVKENGQYYTIVASGEHYGIDETGMDEVFGLTDRFLLAKKDGVWYVCNNDFRILSETITFDAVTQASDGYTAVCRDGKWGVLSDSGSMVLDYVFEDVRVNAFGAVFTDGVGMVKDQGLWYLTTPTGTRVCETGFADAKAPEGKGLIAVADASGKWGFIDQTGTVVIPHQYADAKSFSCHVGAVKMIDQWSYISESGAVVIDLPMEEAEPFHGGLAQAVIAGQLMLLELTALEN